MAKRRFFVPQVRRGLAELTDGDAEHVVRVLRAEVGQEYEISDNNDLYLARITVARKSIVSFEVIEKLPVPPQTSKLTLAAALFKFDRFEWLIEKATELGVNEIAPFEAKRTERGLMRAAEKRRLRWERIALEGSQQARRVRLPEVREAGRFSDALAIGADLRLFLDEDGSAEPLMKELREPAASGVHVAMMVGPEGGWTDEERGEAIARGWKACSLSDTILRAETAGMAGLAIVRAWLQSSGPPDGS